MWTTGVQGFDPLPCIIMGLLKETLTSSWDYHGSVEAIFRQPPAHTETHWHLHKVYSWMGSVCIQWCLINVSWYLYIILYLMLLSICLSRLSILIMIHIIHINYYPYYPYYPFDLLSIVDSLILVPFAYPYYPLYVRTCFPFWMSSITGLPVIARRGWCPDAGKWPKYMNIVIIFLVYGYIGL